MMLIKFINMPFADISIPSIALTQLKSVTEEALTDKVKIDIHYLNHEFGKYLQADNYRFMSLSGEANNSGLGDWFFRQEAFPDEPDNTEDYLVRYGHLLVPAFLKDNGPFLQEKRAGLGEFLDELIDRHGLADADIVGFTSMFMQNVASLAMARRIKERNKDVIIVMGGANCETPMGEELIRNFPVIDYVFSGISLISFPEFIKCLLTGNRTQADFINGVFSRANCLHREKVTAKVVVKEDGKVETVGPIGDELSINEEIYLDYDSFLDSFESSFAHTSLKPYLLFETSRGCWWGAKAHCTFCGLNGGGMSYRAMKNELAIKMIDDLISRYGDRVKHFSCVDNIIPKEYVKGVFPFITRRPDITIFYEVRADLLADEMEILSNAGVNEMQPGIEAISTATLKLMKKGTSAFNNIRFLQYTVTYSILPHWNLLIGFPGEEESVYAKYYEDLPLLHHLPPPSGVFPVRFDRYSPYFTQADKYKLELKPLDYYYYTYPIPEKSLHDMAYYFSDQNYDAHYVHITGKWLAKLRKRVQDWRSKWSGISEVKFPKLHFQEDPSGEVVIDTRYGDRKVIKLDAHDKDILINLDNRKSLEGLHAQFPAMSPETLNAAVHRLKSLGLVFEENGSYMNLVHTHEPILREIKLFHA